MNLERNGIIGRENITFHIRCRLRETNQSRKPLVYKLKAIEEIEKIILKLRLNKKFGTCVGTKLFTIF